MRLQHPNRIIFVSVGKCQPKDTVTIPVLESTTHTRKKKNTTGFTSSAYTRFGANHEALPTDYTHEYEISMNMNARIIAIIVTPGRIIMPSSRIYVRRNCLVVLFFCVLIFICCYCFFFSLCSDILLLVTNYAVHNVDVLRSFLLLLYKYRKIFMFRIDSNKRTNVRFAGFE